MAQSETKSRGNLFITPIKIRNQVSEQSWEEGVKSPLSCPSTSGSPLISPKKSDFSDYEKEEEDICKSFCDDLHCSSGKNCDLLHSST